MSPQALLQREEDWINTQNTEIGRLRNLHQNHINIENEHPRLLRNFLDRNRSYEINHSRTMQNISENLARISNNENTRNLEGIRNAIDLRV